MRSTVCVRQRSFSERFSSSSASQQNTLVRSPETFRTVASPRGISPHIATPIPDSKWVLNPYLVTMLSGIVQCARSISPVSGSIRDGLAWKPLTPVRALPMAMVISVGTSPSHPAGNPSALSMARARQPVLPIVSRRSKHLIVSPESLCLLIMLLSALYIRTAPLMY